MEFREIAEYAIAGAGAIGLKQIIVWVWRRWSNKDRIQAETEKIQAETRSTDIKNLSSIIAQLNDRITRQDETIARQEKRITKLEEAEENCLEEKRTLERKLRDCEDKNTLSDFSSRGNGFTD